MASAGNITAVLSLNSRPFQEGLNSSTSAVTKFVESINKLSSTNAKQGITQLNEQLNNLKTTLDRVSQTNNSSLNTFSKLSSAINKMANGLKILQSDAINVEKSYSLGVRPVIIIASNTQIIKNKTNDGSTKARACVIN